MKRIISILVIILLSLSFLSVNVHAADNSINLRFETSQTETDQVSVKVYTGNFEGVSEGSNLTINIQLNYKAEDIIAVTTQSINNWHVDSSLNEIVFSTNTSTANTEIGTITIMLRTTSSNRTGTFNLQNIMVTGDNGYSENYGNIPVNYTIGSLPGDNQNPDDDQNQGNNQNPDDDQNPNDNQNPDDDQNPNDNQNQGDNQNPNDNQNQGDNQNPSDDQNQGDNQNPSDSQNQGNNQNPNNNQNNSNNNNSSKDDTVAPGKLPYTGWNYIIVGAIGLILATAIFGYIKYKRFE